MDAGHERAALAGIVHLVELVPRAELRAEVPDELEQPGLPRTLIGRTSLPQHGKGASFLAVM
jgi:hypothetical protein